MKDGIHPKYIDSKIICGCGSSFMTKSTKAELHVEVCAKCHPFFTGKQNNLDIQGRIERFNKRYAKGDKAAAEEASKNN